MSNYVGTSWERAKLLVEMGWSAPIPSGSLERARLDAVTASQEDESHPVVLVQRARVDGTVEFHVLGTNATAETAGLVDTFTSILDGARNHLVNAINVGKGDEHVGVPTLAEIRQAHQVAVHKTKKLIYHVKKHLGLKAKRVAPLRPNGKKTTRGAPKVGAKRVAKVGNAAAPAAAAHKVAKADVTVKGTVNGKHATTILRKGAQYSLVKTQGGTLLKRKGDRSSFMIDSGDVGKL